MRQSTSPLQNSQSTQMVTPPLPFTKGEMDEVQRGLDAIAAETLFSTRQNIRHIQRPIRI